ncbi:MAG TPA: hypothetical protein VGN09_13635 [Vicinamibacteria bacterium]|jgi:hypothetical protein
MGGMRVTTLGVLGLVLAACTTIREELPTRPDPTGPAGNPAPLPVVVVPVPVPTPANPAPNTPNNPSNPSNPDPEPPDGGIPPDIPDNTAPVTKLGAKVYFVECGGVEVPGSGGASDAPIGCRVHLDVTPKDANNKPTQVRHTPEWSFSNMSIINLTSSVTGFNPTFIAKAPGTVTAYCEADGVRSNDVTIRLHN